MARDYELLREGRWWWKSILSGIGGGLIMAMFLMAVSAVTWGFYDPLHRIAATFEAFRPPARGLEPASLMTGLALHLATSALWGAALGLLAGRFPAFLSGQGVTTLTGLVYGTLVWLLMGRLIGPALDPAMATVPSLRFFVGHLLYGITAAYVLQAWTRKGELGRALREQAGESGRDVGLQAT